MNFRIITLGCKVNQYESQVMGENMENHGYIRAAENEPADITVINTCTVTSAGDSKNRKLVRRVRRENPQGIIVLTGCMPQAFPEETDLFNDCDIVLGNSSRASLIPALEKFFLIHRQLVLISEHKKSGEAFEKMSASSFEGHTRAFVKIEDGCNRFCSYCIIPYARGRVRSKSLSDLHSEVKALANNGYKEVVLVGINLSAYGQGENRDLCDAVECAAGIDEIERIRLGSLEPERMDKATIERLARCKKLCPQFHLSLQSGCDETLRRMNRHYTSSEYEKIVSDLRCTFENCAITTDIMVGFAGETDDEFEKSLAFARRIEFAKIHTFAYSRRKGTAADKAPYQIMEDVKNQRAKIMAGAAADMRMKFLRSQVGRVERVLFERRRPDGFYEGYTENYTPVRMPSDRDLSGNILTVKIVSADDDYCCAQTISEEK